jgi:hypothetical protein
MATTIHNEKPEALIRSRELERVKTFSQKKDKGKDEDKATEDK